MELNDNPVQFSMYVEKRAATEDTTCLDIVCDYCKDNDIELTVIPKYLTENLRQKIRVEAETLRLYKRSQTVLF
jgi:hypothetical protein